jgi:type VI secretion system secreted protein VgrG
MVRGPAGEEIHTDKFGRYKAQFHWDREAKGTDDDSRWIRKLQETASSMNLARVGWETSVGYIAGDPDRPVGLTRQINGKMRPTYGQPSLKNVMTVKTETYPGKVGFNELRIDDSAGKMRLDWKAERDFITYVKHDKTEKVGNDETHLVKNEMQHTVEKNQTVTVGSNEHKTAKDDYVLNVGANRTKSVGGSEKVSVGESESLKVDGNDTETVASMRRTIAGRFEVAAPDPKALAGKIVPDFPQGGGFQVNKPDPKQILSDMISLKGAINRMSEKAIIKTVGAAYIQLAGAPIFSQAGKLFVEAIGGLKLTVAASETIMQSVSGRMLSTVGGLILKKSKDSMTISAEDTSVTVGGLARFHSDVKVEVRSKSIEITAPGGVTLKQGDLVLDLQPDKTTIKGDVLLNSGKKVTVVGRPDKLTH